MKLPGAFNAQTLLLQHMHFTMPHREEHAYIVDHLARYWVTLPAAPLVCNIRGWCQISLNMLEVLP